jgi:hypothetical protein
MLCNRNERGFSVPPQDVGPKIDWPAHRKALRKAKMLAGMLQGTMGLEGQGLDKRTLRAMTKRAAEGFLKAHQ